MDYFLLEALATRYGETTHYAVLDGREVVYRAKTDPPRGGRATHLHVTAVGKLLLSRRLTTRDAVARWVGDTPLDMPSTTRRVRSA